MGDAQHGLRHIAIFCFVLFLSALTRTAPAETAAYSFSPTQAVVYSYSVKQEVSWQSAGDTLAYTSTVFWKFALKPVTVTADRVELSAVILQVKASHNGPGSTHAMDSAAPDGANGSDDPLLGHLIELEGALLTVVMDPRTGVVSEVRGGDEIIKRINKRFPSAFAGDAPPLDAAARITYGSEALSRQWSEMFALPHTEVQIIPLGQPLTGSIERHWQGSHYSLTLPSGIDHLDGQITKAPTPVSARLTDLAGFGDVQSAGGVPATATGTVTFTLTLNALTQPVLQKHRLTWEMRQVPPK